MEKMPPNRECVRGRVEASTGSRSRFRGDAFRREIPHAQQHGNWVNDGDEISPRNNIEDAEVAVKKPRLRVRQGKA